jgi:hypothetical protein
LLQSFTTTLEVVASIHIIDKILLKDCNQIYEQESSKKYKNYFQFYLVNTMNRKIAPETPNATRKPFQKSVKESLFISFLQVLEWYYYPLLPFLS